METKFIVKSLSQHRSLIKYRTAFLNSLAPRKFEWNFRYVIFKQILVIDGWDISCKITIIWMSLYFTDDQSTLVQVLAWCHQATSHYLSQCWPRSMSPNGVTRPQWVNWLLPSDTIWHHRTWSTLVQVMACCLMAPSHYLNQCWLITNGSLWYSPRVVPQEMIKPLFCKSLKLYF